MKHSSKFVIRTFVFSFALLFNIIAISKEHDLLCTGQEIITSANKTTKNKTSKQIIIKNKRLFIPGMVLLCTKKDHTYNCLKKRLDSRWEARLNINKGIFWYQSHNVSQNKTQKFTSVCKIKSTQ